MATSVSATRLPLTVSATSRRYTRRSLPWDTFYDCLRLVALARQTDMASLFHQAGHHRYTPPGRHTGNAPDRYVADFATALLIPVEAFRGVEHMRTWLRRAGGGPLGVVEEAL